jgi:sulfoxide reductase heme-binding subunit YedZ
MNASVTMTPPRRPRASWKKVLRPAIYVSGVGLAVWIFYQAVTGQLGADPVRGLEHALGLWALRFLVLGLAITPLRRLGGPNLVAYRRAIGLLAFLFATLHILVFVILDQGGDVAAIAREIVKRPYIWVGLAAFLMLVPLAATSNGAMIRRLGGKAWQRLHRLVYPATALVALHFIMSVKSWPPEPLAYAAIVAALLAIRAAFALREVWRRR